MCFNKYVYRYSLESSEAVLKSEKKIAIDDIIVYKIIWEKKFLFMKRYVSAIRGFKYKLHKQYETEIGIRCYLWDKENNVYYYKITANTGFYSYQSLSIPTSLDAPVLAKFIIPKGAIFYVNYENGTYISNKIIFNKVLKSC